MIRMIGKLSCAALLVLPSFAYGQKPSADLSIQIVPPGIACDIGPNYSGPIPAAAQTAGYTHCAANYDFTSATNFSCSVQGCGTGVSYNMSNIATWLGGCGASAPLWWN